MPNNVYLNGSIIPAEDAVISAFDAGFLHGSSSFTTMLAHNGQVFRLGQHLDRLFGTVGLLGLRTQETPESIAAAIDSLLEANALTESRLRVTLTPGPISGDRSGEVEAPRPTTLISAEPLPHYPAQWYDKGLSVVVSSFKQIAGDPTFGYKTGCYLPRILARQEAAAKGADEALWFTTANRLAEACFCNVFLVLGGQVVTPLRDTPVLPGVVRGATLELLAPLGLGGGERELTVQEMLSAEEVFLTSSTMGIRPVVRIERHAVGDETPGPVTRRIMAAYRQLLDAECPPRPPRG